MEWQITKKNKYESKRQNSQYKTSVDSKLVGCFLLLNRAANDPSVSTVMEKVFPWLIALGPSHG